MQEKEIQGLRVMCSPLAFDKSQPMIPMVFEFLTVLAGCVGPMFSSGELKGGDELNLGTILKIAPTLGPVARFMEEDDRLTKYSPRILAMTVVIANDRKYELVKGEDRLSLFNDYPQAFFPILIFAGTVTFKRFFPGTGQSDVPTPTPSS
jgi:hypothetical protein